MHVLKHGYIQSNYKCLCTFYALKIPNHLCVLSKLFALIKNFCWPSSLLLGQTFTV